MKLFWVSFVSGLLAFLAIDAAPTFGTIAITTATASTGLAILGLAKIGTAFALAASRRGKREAEVVTDDNEAMKTLESAIWSAVAKNEVDACLHRFVCEVSTGDLVAPEFEFMVNTLLKDNDKTKADFSYAEAVQSGTKHRNVDKCQKDYKCKSTGAELYSIYTSF